MGDFFLPLILLLIVLAIFTQDGFTITLIYLFAGLYAVGSWWSRKALESSHSHGNITTAFFREKMFQSG
jgi:hypothetical protein